MFEDAEAWLRFGWERGWCGPPVCATCDGIPMSESEDASWGEGYDMCLHILRLYEGADQAREVAENHSPTQWRASNRGWE